MNNYIDFNDKSATPENVSIRDPRFYEKNNAAEQRLLQVVGLTMSDYEFLSNFYTLLRL